MTTLAKIEANQRNGQLSTGPRTPEGKAIVARNATRHGIFSYVPVIPGEDPGAWESHRAGVVESLAPVGLLEVNLAERAALLLWRLQRLARYEAETVAAAMEDVEVPALPPPKPSVPPLFPEPRQMTREEQLRATREDLRKTQRMLAALAPAREFFAGGAEGMGAVPLAVAKAILEAAHVRSLTSEDLRDDPPHFGGKAFLKRMGLEAGAAGESWTPEMILRGLRLYAGFTRESTEEFAEGVRVDIEEEVEESTRAVGRLEREEAAIARLLDGRTARRQSAKLLPADGREERVAKYERHLHSLLTSTLHELERLQALREGEEVPPPAVADLNVTVDMGPG